MTALLDASRWLARNMGAVLPLRVSGKEPLGDLVPHGKDDATTDESVIDGWWSRAPQANIGLRTGGDFFVLDVDPRNGGGETLAQLEHENGPLPITITVLTGGGGAHYYFKHPGGKLKGKAGIGIDVKREGGYVVAPPSMHASGRPYAWAPGRAPGEAAIADAPAWLVELIREQPAPAAPPAARKKSAQAHPTLAAAREAFNREHARDWGTPGKGQCPACGHKDCFGRLPELPEKWFCFSSGHADGVGAERDDGHLGDALDLAAHESGRSTTEHLVAEGYLEDRQAAARGDPATSAGEEPPLHGDIDAPPSAGAAIALQYILVREQDAYFAHATDAVLTRAALNSAHAADKAAGHFAQQLHPDDRLINLKPSTYIDLHARQADNFGWWPGKPLLYGHDGKLLVNRFRPPPPPPTDRPDPTTWLEHLYWIVAAEPEREHLLDVLAYNVQHLGGKVNHAIVLGGGIRTGKDLLLQPLSKWLRSAYVNVKHEELDSAFQHYLKGAKFLTVQEARDLSFDKGFTRYNAFKNIIAAPPEDLPINEKFLRPYKIPNLVQVIFLTNYPNGVYFEDKGDGRYFVIWSPVSPRESAYYVRLGAFVEEQFMDVIGFLARRDVSRFNPKALPPGTAAREEMHAATRSGAEAALVEAVESLTAEKDGVFTKAEMTEEAKRMDHRGLLALLEAGPARLGKIFKDIGLETQRIKVAGKAAFIYWLRGKMDADAAEEIYRRRVRVGRGVVDED